MGEVVNLRDHMRATEPKQRLLATSECLNREPRSFERYLRDRRVSLPCDVEPVRDFSE